MADYVLEAAVARQADAEVSFKLNVFLLETVYNLFGFLVLPFIIPRHGRFGARNRLYTGMQPMAVTSALWVIFFFTFNILHMIYANSEGYSISHFEVLIVDVMYLLRCMTVAGKLLYHTRGFSSHVPHLSGVAAKYSYYSRAELREIDVKLLPPARIVEKLILLGWKNPSPHLLYSELERSIVRTAPTLCGHKILYADSTSRDAMLWEIRKCLPSYLEYELGIDLKAEMEAESKLKAGKSQRTAATKHVDTSVVEAGTNHPRAAGPKGETLAEAEARKLVEMTEEAEECEDMSIEARAYRKFVAWLNSGDTKYCEYDLQSAMKAAASTFQSRTLSRTVSSASVSDSSDAGPRPPAPPPPSRGKQTEVVHELLPFIPAKTIVWYALYDSHISETPSSNLSGWIMYFIGWIFAFLPIIVRGAMGLDPFGTEWYSYLAEATLLYTASVNFSTTCKYVFVAPLDFKRRLKAMEILGHCIDPMNPLATEFRIPREIRRAVDPATTTNTPFNAGGSQETPTFNFLPLAALPVSRMAAERMTELEDCINESGGSGNQHAHGPHTTANTAWRLDGTAKMTTAAVQERVNRKSALTSALDMITAIPKPLVNPIDSGSYDQPAQRENIVPSQNLAAVADSGRSGGSIEGWLTKRAVRATSAFFNAHSWKKRYFIGNSQDRTVTYSLGPGQPAIYTLKLGSMSRVELFPQKPNSFKLTVDMSGRSSGDLLIAAANSPQTMEAWVAFIQGMIESAIDPSAALASAAHAAVNVASEPLLTTTANPVATLSPIPITAVAIRPQTPESPTPAEDEDAAASAIVDNLLGGSTEEAEEMLEVPDGDAADEPRKSTVAKPATLRSSILARHRLIAMDAKDGSTKATSKLFFPVLYGENLVSWHSIRQLCLDFGETYKRRIQLYTAFFAILCVIGIIMLFFRVGQMNTGRADEYAMLALVAFTQLMFSVLLAFSIVTGATLNENAMQHRFKLSRIETLICDFMVAAETPGLSASGRLSGQLAENPVQKQLTLTRQVASSLSSALMMETTIMPAKVLFMPANFALLSTFWSLSMSGVLSAVRTFQGN